MATDNQSRIYVTVLDDNRVKIDFDVQTQPEDLSYVLRDSSGTVGVSYGMPKGSHTTRYPLGEGRTYEFWVDRVTGYGAFRATESVSVTIPMTLCPQDPSHYLDSHAPGGAWFGVGHHARPSPWPTPVCQYCGGPHDGQTTLCTDDLPRVDRFSLVEEWAVRHSQGIHPGPFTEKAARQWIADDIKRDHSRQYTARGKQRLLRRYVTEWEEVD